MLWNVPEFKRVVISHKPGGGVLGVLCMTPSSCV